MQERLKKLSEKILNHVKKIQNEEETKHAFVLPFLQLLGYDVFHPDQVKPEYTADIGNKAGEKVDYAVLKNEKLCFFIECKACTVHLDKAHCHQLKRYFNAIPEVPFGILTNGLIYRFYADFQHKNIMDDTPFLELDLTDFSDTTIQKISYFTKENFDVRLIRELACCWQYEEKMRMVLQTERQQLSDELFRFFLKKANLDHLSVDANLTESTKNKVMQQLKQQVIQFVGSQAEQLTTGQSDRSQKAVSQTRWYYFDDSVQANIFSGKKLQQARIFGQLFVGKKSWASLTGEILGTLFGRLNSAQQQRCANQFKFLILKTDSEKLRNAVEIKNSHYVLDTNTSVLTKYQQISKILAFLKTEIQLDFIQEIAFELSAE